MALYTPEYKPTGDEIAVLHTSKGDIRVQLAGKDAPIHVGNFVELARKGFYDNLKFHRYVPGFVIQGGCPTTRELTPEQVIKEGSRRGCGTGNPGYSIKEEFTTNPHNEHNDGTLAMARARSQFACNFFACAGIRVVDNTFFHSVEEGAKAALDSGAEIVVICAADDDYATLAPKAKELLDERALFVVAGAPASQPELEAQGITRFISVRSNVLETLREYVKELGI